MAGIDNNSIHQCKHFFLLFRNNGTDNAYVLGSDIFRGDFPHKVYGAAAFPVETDRTIMVAGGVTPDGEYPREFYAYDSTLAEWNVQPEYTLDPPRAYPVVVMVEEQDCP